MPLGLSTFISYIVSFDLSICWFKLLLVKYEILSLALISYVESIQITERGGESVISGLNNFTPFKTFILESL